MTQTKLRLKKELEELNKIESKDFGAEPFDDSDMFNWQAFIIGPEESPYEGGYFNLKIEFHSDFPFKPPRVYFQTKILSIKTIYLFSFRQLINHIYILVLSTSYII